MGYLKKSILLSVALATQIVICMESESPAKRQKTNKIKINIPQSEAERERIRLELAKKEAEEKRLIEKLQKLKFEEIKEWTETARFAGCVVAYETDIEKSELVKSHFHGTKYALILQDKIECQLCHQNGYQLHFLYKSRDNKITIVVCDDKLKNQKKYFKIRLLTLEEVQKLLEMAKTNSYIFGHMSATATKDLLARELKLKNLLPESKRKYLYNILESVRLLWIGFYKDTDKNGKKTEISDFHESRMPKDMVILIIKFLVNMEAESSEYDSFTVDLEKRTILSYRKKIN